MRKISVLFLLATAGCAVTPIQSSSDKYGYPVVINYNVTVDSLLKDGQHEGKYFVLDPDINSRNFSLTVAGEKKVVVLLAHVDKQPMTYSEILKALYKRHLRPANTQEFLFFVQQYDLDLRDWYRYSEMKEVVCLDSSYKQKNSFYSEALRWHASEELAGFEGIAVPVVDLTFLELNWLSDSYFAVVSTDSMEEDVEIKPKTLER